MENNKIIIVALIVIIIAILTIFATFSMGLVKTDTKITIMSNESLNHDDYLEVGLQNESDNLSGKTIYFKFIDEKGNVSEYSVDTDVNGKAKLNLKNIDAGNYTVNITFKGDDKYNPSSASQKLEVKEDVVEAQETSSNEGSESSSSKLNYDSKYNLYYDDNGIIVDPTGENLMDTAGKSYQEVHDQYQWIEENGLR